MQASAQTKFPQIIHSTVSSYALELTLQVAENLDGFQGHFAGNPILPGVVQVHWAVHFAREYLQLDTPVMRVEKLKFTHIIQPPKTITLRIETNNDKKTARFRFDSETLAFSQGQLVYA